MTGWGHTIYKGNQSQILKKARQRLLGTVGQFVWRFGFWREKKINDFVSHVHCYQINCLSVITVVVREKEGSIERD